MLAPVFRKILLLAAVGVCIATRMDVQRSFYEDIAEAKHQNAHSDTSNQINGKRREEYTENGPGGSALKAAMQAAPDSQGLTLEEKKARYDALKRKSAEKKAALAAATARADIAKARAEANEKKIANLKSIREQEEQERAAMLKAINERLAKSETGAEAAAEKKRGEEKRRAEEERRAVEKAREEKLRKELEERRAVEKAREEKLRKELEEKARAEQIREAQQREEEEKAKRAAAAAAAAAAAEKERQRAKEEQRQRAEKQRQQQQKSKRRSWPIGTEPRDSNGNAITEQRACVILGITQSEWESEEAEAVLKKAYRKKARDTHPDKHEGEDDATAAFQEVGSAKDVLEFCLGLS